MEQQKNIAEIQRKFTVEIDARTLKRITPFDRNELTTAYMKLFSGFAWVNWATGHSLGRAWQTALTQAGTFCEAKNKQNPAAKYLSATYRGHKKYWSRVIMMHPGRDGRGDPADSRMALYREHGARMIRAAMSQINLILARYNEHTLSVSRADANQSAAPAPAPAPQAMAQQPAPAPAPMAQPERVAQPEHVAQPERVAQPEHVAQPERMAQPERVAQPEHVAQPERMAHVKPAVQSDTVSRPQAAPVAKPARRTYVAPTIKPVEPAPAATQTPRNEFAVAERRVETKIEQINAAQMRFKFQTQIRAQIFNRAFQNNIGRAA